MPSQFVTPDLGEFQRFDDACSAVAQLEALYEASCEFLCKAFSKAMKAAPEGKRIRAYYPMVRIETTSYAQIDSRLSYGHV
nr:AMP nucleosidase [Alphaproteobacteria bacterium]